MKKAAGFISAAGLVFTVACGQTDAGITTNVKTKLAADEVVKAYQVDVDTQNHVVTLSGDVETMAAREQAVHIARTTTGVRDVIDQLRVTPTAATTGVDNDIDVKGDVDVDVDDDVKAGAQRTGEAVKDGAQRTGEAVKEGAERTGEAVKDGARKTGRAIKDAVTDDDRDSDKDGK
jgi:hypothetical protein